MHARSPIKSLASVQPTKNTQNSLEEFGTLSANVYFFFYILNEVEVATFQKKLEHGSRAFSVSEACTNHVLAFNQ